MKRRALLLGVLLMPTAAHAATKQAPKKTRRQAAAAAPLQPLKAAKTQLVPFNSSAFPYRGLVPDTRKPFLDVRKGRRRGHTTLKGEVRWEDTTYSDRRSLLYLPPGYNARQPGLIVLYLHGQGATLERDVMQRQGLPRQIAASGKNVALVAPQLAFDAADSSAGNFWRPGFFATYLDEAAERLMRLHGDRRAGPHFNAAPVVIVAYSGGYLSAAYALQRGGAAHRVKGVVLMDALYGDEDKFAGWAAARRNLGFLFSAFTESTKTENATLQGLLARRRIPFATTLPAILKPGTMSFVGAGSKELHVDFMTRAWAPDPLVQTLAMIPDFEQAAPAPPSRASKKT